MRFKKIDADDDRPALFKRFRYSVLMMRRIARGAAVTACCWLTACHFNYTAWFPDCGFDNQKFYAGEPATLVFCIDGSLDTQGDVPRSANVTVESPDGTNVDAKVTVEARTEPVRVTMNPNCVVDAFEESALAKVDFVPPVQGTYRITLKLSGPGLSDSGIARFELPTRSPSDPVSVQACGETRGQK